MRIICTAILFLISFTSSSQSGYREQIKALIDDVPNRFSNYIGSKDYGSDSTGRYSSKLIIEGTGDNKIHLDSNSYGYTAYTEGWLSKKEARQIVEGWKKQLKGVYGPFNHKKREAQSLVADDFEYVKGNMILTLTYFTTFNSDKYYTAGLHIYFYPKTP